MSFEKKKKTFRVRIKLPEWESAGDFFRAAGRGCARAGKIVLKIIKWPVLVAVPIGVFILASWFSLINTFSGEAREVPEIVGKTPEEAALILASRGFILDEDYVNKERKPSAEIERGLIIGQEPRAGARVKRGKVSVSLSAGFQKILVPNLLYNPLTMRPMTLREAELEAGKKGLNLLKKYTIFSAEAPDNRDNYVIAQTPQPSISFIKEDRMFVEVLTAVGPVRRMAMLPRLEGRPLLPVVNFLRENGIPFQAVTSSGMDVSNRSEYELRLYRIDWVSDDANWFFYADSPPSVILHVKEETR
jgi:beta-lactam-binding protein with PASTA domain